MLNILAVVSLVIRPAPMIVDTPPPLPIPVERLAQLNSMADIISATRLGDGSPAPADLVLPRLVNRNDVMKYMLENYPPSLRDRHDFEMPWAWLRIDEHGQPGEIRIVKASGQPAFDSLALAALRVARFAPAILRGEPVAVWSPLPIQAAYERLAQKAPRERPRTDEPYFTPYTLAPKLLNRDEVAKAMVQSYPPALRDAGKGGEIGLWLFVDKEGRIVKSQVRTSSGNPDLDSAALAVARAMRFAPARNREEVVAVWITLPIKFTPNPKQP